MKIYRTILVMIALIFLVGIASAQTFPQTTVCCEKTTYGAWCQNTKPENCNPLFRQTPTSCDATSYCKEGCCYDSQDGMCMESTPQKVCQMNNGTWADSAKCEIPQCNMGCCILDNQAAFVTLVRCKKLSALYGLQTNFRPDIQSESACIGIAQGEDRGACVFEEDFIKTCKFTTRLECDAMKGKKVGNSTALAGNVTFYKDYLCTAEELATNCAPSNKGNIKTGCIEGKDEVYFFDTCGNPANIYDASKLDDNAYWRKVVPKKESCGFANTNGNANSASCGNCDYFSGSFCRKYDKTKDSVRPQGDYICRDLNCKATSDGKDYRHGESWCVYDAATGAGKDPVGSRQFKHICVAGEELVEPCGDFRSEVCIQDKISTEKGDFQQAGCRVNRWQDCIAQKSQTDCENIDRRDCRWVEGAVGTAILAGVVQQQTGATQAFGGVQNPIFTNPTTITGSAIFGGDDEEENKTTTLKGPVCVPDIPPGQKFWSAGEAQGICANANAACTVEYEKTGIIGGTAKCVKNCECEGASWKQKNEEICKSLGDCTGSEGVYKYLQSGGFGVSGTRLFMPIIDFISGASVKAAEINDSINKGILESFKK